MIRIIRIMVWVVIDMFKIAHLITFRSNPSLKKGLARYINKEFLILGKEIGTVQFPFRFSRRC